MSSTNPVRPLGDGREVATGGEQEGAASRGLGFVGDQIHGSGKVLGQPPVDDEDVLVQAVRCTLRLGWNRGAFFRHSGGPVGPVQVDQAGPGILAGADRKHPYVEGAVLVLGRDARVVPRRLLLLVDLLGTLLLKNLSGHGFSVDPDGELRNGSVLGDGEGVEDLQVASVGVVEQLLHGCNGLAVLDQHLCLVVANLQGR